MKSRARSIALTVSAVIVAIYSACGGDVATSRDASDDAGNDVGRVDRDAPADTHSARPPDASADARPCSAVEAEEAVDSGQGPPPHCQLCEGNWYCPLGAQGASCSESFADLSAGASCDDDAGSCIACGVSSLGITSNCVCPGVGIEGERPHRWRCSDTDWICGPT